MSERKDRLIYVAIFAAFFLGGFFLFIFLVKPKLISTQQAKSAQPLPADYQPPPTLTRIDRPKVVADPGVSPRVAKALPPAAWFNTIDDAGNFFLFGVYKTTSNKTLISGVVQYFDVGKNLQLHLEDEYGDLIPVTIAIPITAEGLVRVGLRNTPAALDLRQPSEIIPRQLNSFKESLVGSRVVVEVRGDANLETCLKNACDVRDLVYDGEILYLAYLTDITDE